VKLVLIFHEAQLVGGFFFGVLPLFPKWGCCTHLTNLTDGMVIKNQSFVLCHDSVTKEAKQKSLAFCNKSSTHANQHHRSDLVIFSVLYVKYQDLGSAMAVRNNHTSTTFCRPVPHATRIHTMGTKLGTSPS